LTLFFVCAYVGTGFCAVGCDLNDPDRDIRRFFPESTGYKTAYLSVAKLGGEDLYREIEARLGDRLNGIYEKIDVPYTVYTVLKQTETIGYVHGVNQKGKYGGMQVFLILTPEGKIARFYFQKLTSKQAAALRSEDFGRQFIGMTLNDFDAYDVLGNRAEDGSKAAQIVNPNPEDASDFRAALRGTKKNLILMKYFTDYLQGQTK
jgi:hypothetical protein